MAGAYRLRVTLKGCELILECRDQRGETWQPAGLYSFDRPPQASSAFRWLQKYTGLPHVIRDKFKAWGCDIPGELEEPRVTLLMSEDAFRLF